MCRSLTAAHLLEATFDIIVIKFVQSQSRGTSVVGYSKISLVAYADFGFSYKLDLLLQ